MRGHLSPQHLGVVSALIANTIWGVAAIYWVETRPAAAWDVFAHRALWTLPFMVVILLLLRRGSELLTRLREPRILAWSAVAALLLSVNWSVFIYAVTSGYATEAGLGYFMLPLMSILAASIFLGERPTPIQTFAIGCAVCAVGVLMVAEQASPWIPLSVSISFALYGVVRKKTQTGSLDGLYLESLMMAPWALLWIIYRDGAGIGAFGWRVDLFLLLSGAFTAAPLITYVTAVRVLPLTTLGLFGYIGPTLQILVAVLYLGGPVTEARVWALVLVWLGVFAVGIQTILSWRGGKRPRH